MKKLLSILSLASISTTFLVNSALAEPFTFRGQKGTYTINISAGTYRGCLFSGGCVNLGRKYLVPCVADKDSEACDQMEWKKGQYTYSVFPSDGQTVTVYKNGERIFDDAVRR
jgi:hypothetical protein